MAKIDFLREKKEKKNRVHSEKGQRASRLPVLVSVITFQFEALVVSLSDMRTEMFSCQVHLTFVLKGLIC